MYHFQPRQKSSWRSVYEGALEKIIFWLIAVERSPTREPHSPSIAGAREDSSLLRGILGASFTPFSGFEASKPTRCFCARASPKRFLCPSRGAMTRGDAPNFRNRGSRGGPADHVLGSLLPDYVPDQRRDSEAQVARGRKGPATLVAEGQGRMYKSAPGQVRKVPGRDPVIPEFGSRQGLSEESKSFGGIGGGAGCCPN
jgi:hypothetical protein